MRMREKPPYIYALRAVFIGGQEGTFTFLPSQCEERERGFRYICLDALYRLGLHMYSISDGTSVFLTILRCGAPLVLYYDTWLRSIGGYELQLAEFPLIQSLSM